MILPLVDIVVTFPQVEIENTDGIHLLHLLVGIAKTYVFGYRLCHAVEDALEIEHLPSVLHLHDDYLPLAVFGLDVHTVKLVVFPLLVALALENVHNLHLLAEEHGEETLQHTKVGFLPQQPLYRPVKAYVSVCYTHIVRLVNFMQI